MSSLREHLHLVPGNDREVACEVSLRVHVYMIIAMIYIKKIILGVILYLNIVCDGC